MIPEDNPFCCPQEVRHLKGCDAQGSYSITCVLFFQFGEPKTHADSSKNILYLSPSEFHPWFCHILYSIHNSDHSISLVLFLIGILSTCQLCPTDCSCKGATVISSHILCNTQRSSKSPDADCSDAWTKMPFGVDVFKLKTATAVLLRGSWIQTVFSEECL